MKRYFALKLVFAGWLACFGTCISLHAQAATSKAAFTGKYFHPSAGQHRSSNVITIKSEPVALGAQTFSVQLPEDAVANSLRVTLNGRDVTNQFRGSSTTLSAQEGLSTVKNVISATVRTSSGGTASGRLRMMSAPVVVARNNVRSKTAAPMVRANAVAAAASVCDPVAMCPAWLPPSVRFDTLTPGGWTKDPHPWIAVNGTQYPVTGDTPTGSQYVLIALDRQTLQITDFSWFADAASFTSYIKAYTQNWLVIAGTTAGANAVDSTLDTSSIGGTNFSTLKSGSTYPKSYMIIGAVGQAAGTAYENSASANAFATGSLLEDANGNYNFQSTDIVEYAMETQDSQNNGNPTIRMNVPQNLSVNGESQIEFLPNGPANVNGVWLLVLDQTALMPPYNPSQSGTCYDTTTSGPLRIMANCGTFYAVGIGNGNIDGEWKNLGNALSAIQANQIVFLQSIGTVGSNTLAQTVESGSVFPTQNFTGFMTFATAFEGVGGTPMAVAGPTFTNQDSYAFVGYLGAGNALAGGAAETSTALPGQSGVLHGTLQRDRTGLYRPAQASAESQGLFDYKGGLVNSDFTLATTSYQQPIPWPSNSSASLLAGASTIPGQQAAYRFLSHWLLAGYYMRGIQGPHQDDIHYFFSSSTNTSINYQAMDPAKLQFPIQGTWDAFGCSTSDGTTCTFQAPGDSASSAFTSSDFNAVKGQLSTEVIYLTNTLQYLVTGSTNLKDVVAAGNANVGLALSAAANTILGSGMGNLNSQEIANKTVTFSWQALIGTLGGIAQTAADLEAGLELAPTPWNSHTDEQKATIKKIAAASNAIGALMSTIGSGGGIKTTTHTLSSDPQPFAQLTTTVGELATQNLQSPLILSFDMTADNLTSDWGRLSTIGPRVVNTNDPVFFAPDQASQYTSINALTTASSRTFYFSLLPQVYNLHYWRSVLWHGQSSGVFQPSVGSYQSHDEGPTCNAFYLSPNNNNGQNLGTLSVNQGMTYPTMGGVPMPFLQDSGYVDFWVIDGVVSKAGSQSTNITIIDPDLATSLFAYDQMNASTLQFFAANGPMAGVVKDASVDKISGWDNGDICDASDPYYDLSANTAATPPATSGGTDKSGRLLTTTNMISPVSGVLGHDMTFTARVMAGNQPAASGVAYISIDGTVVGNPSMGADGTASITVPGGIALGKHQVQVDYAAGAGYAASSAQPSVFIVYSESADLAISMASQTINVSYNAASTPATLQIGSIAGLSGDVALSCTGLPAGLACTFNSQSLKLSADGSVNATVQIGPSQTTQASILFLTLPLLGLGCLLKGRSSPRLLAVLLIIGAGATIGTLTGCGGSPTTTTAPSRETGSKTISVSARVGSVSRSVGLNINIQ